jgi:hypothetical protein
MGERGRPTGQAQLRACRRLTKISRCSFGSNSCSPNQMAACETSVAHMFARAVVCLQGRGTQPALIKEVAEAQRDSPKV